MYFKGLISERMIVKRVHGRDTITWEPRSDGIRNEPLDTRVYATGALELLNPNFEMHRQRRMKKAGKNIMPKLKQPEIQPQAQTHPEVKKAPENRKPIVKRRMSPSTGIFRRGLRM